eukprot:scaffold15545_cov19-Tisochrysis_lutea.AAC.6
MIPGRRAPSLWFTLKLPHAQVESKDTALERIKMKAANCSVPEKCWNRESFSQCNSLFPNKVCTAWKEDGKPPAVVFVSILALDEAVWFPESFALGETVQPVERLVLSGPTRLAKEVHGRP